MDGALSVDAARERILADSEPLPPIELPLLEAHSCVVGSDVFAEADVPAFASSEVHGFAVRSADLHGASQETPVRLRLVGWSRVGRAPEASVGWGQATGIEAGAALPVGADSVVTAGVLEG
ncbi:MAG TPA: molybdopterin molybdenumtransferase MoeA, partial [Actinomycetota bacterium]|nr:molybdopterin molybdenumtransferase MoeA [Actinomycetota bacterium]